MPESPLRLIFAGTPDFAAQHLSFLLEQLDRAHYEIVAVYTQPDRPAGRGKKLTASPVKQVAEAHQIPVLQPLNFKESHSVKELASFKPDVMIVVAYGLILPTSVLQTPTFGCINVHASLLPRWRGAAPIQRAIEAGDTQTGITIMQMDEGLDPGDMLHTVTCNIESTHTASDLHDTLATLGGPALLNVLQQIPQQALSPQKQDDSQSCYADKINKPEAKLDWSLSANELDRKIRAFNPFPICFFEMDDKNIRVWQSTPTNHNHSEKPGTIIMSSKSGIEVACGEHSLLLKQLQFPGKKAMAVSDLLNAYQDSFNAGKILQ